MVLAAATVAGCAAGDDDTADVTTVSSPASPATSDASGEPRGTQAVDSESDGSSTFSTTTTTTTTMPPVAVATSAEPVDENPPEGGGMATGALGDADVEVVTDAGTIQIGVAEVPAGVSDTFPIPDDLDVQLSSATGTDFGFSGVSAMAVADLATFYENGLIAAGYEITARQEIVGVLAVYTFERGQEAGQVAISEAPGSAGSSVLVTIGDGSSLTAISVGG